ncbi:recombinase family protein [Fundidesulfovibrio putealis]|uniref:recombinase family protein n=1 Tax=Fundidesulfovibrio putealis TaxID=270496 RepID=UPI0005B7D400|nr:recombinase family protein [Fundidesulfovibrio putealis]
MSGQHVGYVRVSSVDQNLARQLDGVSLDERFEDKASGKDTNRPGLEGCLKHLRRGDTLHVHSMDRLARSLADLLRLVKELTERGVAVQFHKEALTFTGEPNPMQDLQLAVMGAVAEFERSMIKERQREGIAAAKAAGKHLGRSKMLTPEQVKEIKERKAKGETVKALAVEFGISRQSLYANYPDAVGKPAA